MYPALNTWTLPRDAAPAAWIASARAAGFDGVELTVDPDGPLPPHTPPAAFAQLAAQARDSGIAVVGLATGAFWNDHFASADPAARARAHGLTLRLLDRAVAASAGAVLVVPAVVGRAADRAPEVGYADAYARALDALCALRFEAESRAVYLAIENVWNRFLLSPLEAAAFIDGVNSPYVGFYLDVGNVLAFGYPEDWIDVLGPRIVRVHAKDYRLADAGLAGFCPLGEGSVAWDRVIAALREIRYDGPLTYEGDGPPREMARRLANIIAGRGPLEPESPA